MKTGTMTAEQLRNGMIELRFVNAPEFIASGIPADQWPKFRDDPLRWFIRTTQEHREALWQTMKATS